MREDRAVSSTISYVLTLTIATLLVTGLMVSGSSFVNDRREEVVRNELQVIGQQVAADFEQADRLVQASDTSASPAPTVRLTQSFPDRVSGSPYEIAIESEDPDVIVLTSTDPDIEITVEFGVQTGLDTTASADGGSVQIRYTGSALEVRDV